MTIVDNMHLLDLEIAIIGIMFERKGSARFEEIRYRLTYFFKDMRTPAGREQFGRSFKKLIECRLVEQVGAEFWCLSERGIKVYIEGPLP
jgi:hypothetical protein